MLQKNIITIHVPFEFHKQKGRRPQIIQKVPLDQRETNVNITLIKALAKSWYWNSKISNGKAASTEEIAHQENISGSYVAKIMRLNYLAPEIVTAIIDGKQPKTLLLADLMGNFPDMWEDQKKQFGFLN